MTCINFVGTTYSRLTHRLGLHVCVNDVTDLVHLFARAVRFCLKDTNFSFLTVIEKPRTREKIAWLLANFDLIRNLSSFYHHWIKDSKFPTNDVQKEPLYR